MQCAPRDRGGCERTLPAACFNLDVRHAYGYNFTGSTNTNICIECAVHNHSVHTQMQRLRRNDKKTPNAYEMWRDTVAYSHGVSMFGKSGQDLNSKNAYEKFKCVFGTIHGAPANHGEFTRHASADPKRVLIINDTTLRVHTMVESNGNAQNDYTTFIELYKRAQQLGYTSKKDNGKKDQPGMVRYKRCCKKARITEVSR